MPRDAAATRAAILQAAVGEFAAHGFAGARVDRIAGEAGSNKRMIYIYFEDKEGLFTAALQHVIADLVHAVPITEGDLPGYAVALFDHLLAHPEAFRLTLWRQLERPEGGPAMGDVYAEKIEALRELGRANDWALPPTDILVLVQGMAIAWLVSPIELLRADGPEPYSRARVSAHRTALRAAVVQLLAAKDAV